jgi:hypothetical protein
MKSDARFGNSKHFKKSCSRCGHGKAHHHLESGRTNGRKPMRAYARRTNRPRKFSKRKLSKSRTLEPPPPPPPPPPALPPVPPALPLLNVYYECGWSDSWQFRRCMHIHPTIREAVQCGMQYRPYSYVFAVENSVPRQLNDAEDEIVNHFRFGKDAE